MGREFESLHSDQFKSEVTMSKSSLEYAEMSGINICLAKLNVKRDKTKEDEIVIRWLTARAEYLKNL